jgi:hypothetical protein
MEAKPIPYLREKLPALGGWNPDATESSMPKGGFIEGRNYRKVRPGEWEIRTGITSWTKSGTKIPRAGGEYRLDDLTANIILYEESGSLKAWVVNKETTPDIDVTISDIVTGDSDYIVDCAQFNNFFIITVFGHGLYALFPSATDLTAWNAPISLGKRLTPYPSEFNYSEDVVGDLILYDYISPAPNNGTDFKIKYPLGESKPIKIRLPLEARYKLIQSNSNLLTAKKLLKRFEWDKEDGDKKITSRDATRKEHLHKRGWFYRFQMKSQYTDAKGQKFIYYHEGSADCYIPDNHYAPPFAANDDGGSVYSSLRNLNNTTPNQWLTALDPNGAESIIIFPSKTATSIIPPVVVTDEDWLDLQTKFKNLFKETSGDQGGNGTRDPFYFAARVLGWQTNMEVFLYGFPYLTSVPASELLGAPQAIFDWANFGTLPADVFEIEVWRTAHTDSPLFEDYTYGLVGVIKKDGTFTDKRRDDELEFTGSLEKNSGYLTGQFSGKKLRVYMGNLRLGDVETKYEIHKPTVHVQCFGFIIPAYLGLTSYVDRTKLSGDAGDGLPEWNYGYQYVDGDGNVSEMEVITVDDDYLIEIGGSGSVGLAFTFPRGYDPSIKTIYLFEGRYSGGTRTYRKVESIDPANGHTLYLGVSSWVSLPEVEEATVETSHDPGASVWSEEGDMFFWPQENFEIEHQFAPITEINTVVGPAYIATDQTMNMTRYDGQYQEEISSEFGNISRRSATKVGKVLYFLSSQGLFVAEGSGVRPFPANVQQTVLKYLREEISGVAPLANARRASLGFLKRRNELWLHFPSSEDLGGTLPPITIVYRFYRDYGMPNEVENYQFDLTPTDNPTTPVIFIESGNGRMFATYFDDTNTRLALIDCDASNQWLAKGYLTLPMVADEAELQKLVREVMFTADVDAKLSIITGRRRTDGVEDDLTYGLIETTADIYPMTVSAGSHQLFRHEVAGKVNNQVGYIPCIRIISEKSDGEGNPHLVRLKSMTILYDVAHIK